MSNDEMAMCECGDEWCLYHTGEFECGRSGSVILENPVESVPKLTERSKEWTVFYRGKLLEDQFHKALKIIGHPPERHKDWTDSYRFSSDSLVHKQTRESLYNHLLNCGGSVSAEKTIISNIEFTHPAMFLCDECEEHWAEKGWTKKKEE